MKDDCYEQVEKHSCHIFRAILVKVHRLTFLICKKMNKKQTNKQKQQSRDTRLEPKL